MRRSDRGASPGASGSDVLFFDGRRQTYAGTIPPLDPLSLLDAQRLVAKLNRMPREFDPAAPWAAARTRATSPR